MSEINKKQVVVINWEDACIHGRDQYSADDPELKLAYGFSAGVLVKETKKSISLCLDMFNFGDKNYRTVQTYPKSGIKSIKRFKFKKEKG
ncbi:MAG: hypothetical protein PHS93_10125 [Candidatus Omnitrophica bacterium]|nr:hypothetical protein [Candidatus Omnitrophota bacterium]